MQIRTADKDDISGLLCLYKQFKGETFDMSGILQTWGDILGDVRQKVVIATENSQIFSTCVLAIIPNLTHGGRPYALVENVITDEKHRKKGYGTAVLNYAKNLAVKENCYKMMLMTGSKLETTLKFYEQAGYNKNDKTAFIQWL